MRAFVIFLGLLLMLGGGAVAGAQYAPIDLSTVQIVNQVFTQVPGSREFLATPMALYTGGGAAAFGFLLIIVAAATGGKKKKKEVAVVKQPSMARETIRPSKPTLASTGAGVAKPSAAPPPPAAPAPAAVAPPKPAAPKPPPIQAAPAPAATRPAAPQTAPAPVAPAAPRPAAPAQPVAAAPVAAPKPAAPQQAPAPAPRPAAPAQPVAAAPVVPPPPAQPKPAAPSAAIATAPAAPKPAPPGQPAAVQPAMAPVVPRPAAPAQPAIAQTAAVEAPRAKPQASAQPPAAAASATAGAPPPDPRMVNRKRVQDLVTINDALKAYYAKIGLFPKAAGLAGANERGADWIPGLTPDYLKELPRDPMHGPGTQYVYASDGPNYKLIVAGASLVGSPNVEVLGIKIDPTRNPTQQNAAFGFWSPGFAAI